MRPTISVHSSPKNSMRRRVGLGILALTAGAGLVATSAVEPAHASLVLGSTYSLHHITVDVNVGPQRDQHCTVDADIYQPDGSSRHHQVPAIVTTNGFGGSKSDDNATSIGKSFAREGYLVLAYTGLGSIGSDCDMYLDAPDYDGVAGSQLIDVLAGSRSYVEDGVRKRLHLVSTNRPGDPRVGMIGGSYGGEVQYAVSSVDKRLDAIVPMMTWNDFSYSMSPNNTDLAEGVTSTTPGVSKNRWLDLFTRQAAAARTAAGTSDPSACPGFPGPVCSTSADVEANGYPDARTRSAERAVSVSSYVDSVHTPTLLVQGQKDTLFNLQEAVATFRQLRAQGVPVKMIWQSWGHSDRLRAPGELGAGSEPLRTSYLGRRYLDWMNHYVRGQVNAPTGPRFAYFRDWISYNTSPLSAGTSIEQAYGTDTGFSDTPTATVYLSGDDELSAQRDDVRDGSSSYANQAGTATSYSELPAGVTRSSSLPMDRPGTFAAYTTAPLTADADLVGSPRLSVRLSAPSADLADGSDLSSDLVLFAKLYDVAPDGTETLHDHLISPVRVADLAHPVSITLPAVAQQFPAGHRLRLVLAASDTSYAGNDAVHPVTVSTSTDAPGSLALPLTTPLSVSGQ